MRQRCAQLRRAAERAWQAAKVRKKHAQRTRRDMQRCERSAFMACPCAERDADARSVARYQRRKSAIYAKMRFATRDVLRYAEVRRHDDEARGAKMMRNMMPNGAAARALSSMLSARALLPL